MRWGEDNPEWTAATLEALEAEGVTLLSSLPADVMQYCPGYAAATRENRAAFWAGLLSAVARHESGLDQSARAGGRFGLLRITRRTASANGCGGSLLRAEDNLKCAVRIMARHVAQDGAIGGGAETAAADRGGWRGLARDWLPLRSATQRDEIASWTRRQSYCR